MKEKGRRWKRTVCKEKARKEERKKEGKRRKEETIDEITRMQ